MLNLLPQEFSSKKGFTLIEVVIAIGFSGMFILMFFSIMRFTELNTSKVQIADNYLLNGRYVTEYISEDIMLADEIISQDDYCPENLSEDNILGFFLINRLVDDEKISYQHIYYDLTQGSLYRRTFDSNIRCPNKAANNGGNNRFLDNVVEIENSYFNNEDFLVYLEIKTMEPENNKEYIFTETKYLGNF